MFSFPFFQLVYFSKLMFYISSVGMTLVNLMSFYVNLKLFKELVLVFLKGSSCPYHKGRGFCS